MWGEVQILRRDVVLGPPQGGGGGRRADPIWTLDACSPGSCSLLRSPPIQLALHRPGSPAKRDSWPGSTTWSTWSTPSSRSPSRSPAPGRQRGNTRPQSPHALRSPAMSTHTGPSTDRPGRAKQEPTLRRSEPLALRLRPGERDDIQRLAEAWGVGSSTAAWALLSDALAQLREAPPHLGNHSGLILAASRRILERHGLADQDQDPRPVR